MVLDVQDGLVYELSVTAFVDAYAVAYFEQVLLQVFEALDSSVPPAATFLNSSMGF